MAYVVVADFYAKAGMEEQVAEWLRVMAPHSNAEPGCVMYIVNQHVEDPRRFLLYEQYVDEAGFNAHRETEPFKEYIAGKVLPALDDRQVNIFRVIE